MKFDLDIGNELVEVIADKYPALPRGKTWIKYGKKRIYFNEKKENIDYGFYIQFYSDKLEISEIIETYWFERLEISRKQEFFKIIDELYFDVAYPIKEKLPFTTVSQIRKYRRFEAIEIAKKEETVKIRPVFFDIEIELEKEYFDQILTSSRKYSGKFINRYVIKFDKISIVADLMEKFEDEADLLLMDQMTKSLGDTIQVGNSSENRKMMVEDNNAKEDE